MLKSIITDDFETCYFCGMPAEAIHHVLPGTAKRRISDVNGFTVPLCNKCHNMSNGAVHFDRTKDILLRRICQLYYEKEHSREEWRKLAGRNYLEKEDLFEELIGNEV